MTMPMTTQTTIAPCIQIQVGLTDPCPARYSAARNTATTVRARIFASSGSDQCSM
jgi:hypothetical protein